MGIAQPPDKWKASCAMHHGGSRVTSGWSLGERSGRLEGWRKRSEWATRVQGHATCKETRSRPKPRWRDGQLKIKKMNEYIPEGGADQEPACKLVFTMCDMSPALCKSHQILDLNWQYLCRLIQPQPSLAQFWLHIYNSSLKMLVTLLLIQATIVVWFSVYVSNP